MTIPSATPVLWISGAPGTGKTTTGWHVYELLTAAGASCAYVDIDQLGLLGPFERLSGAAPHLVKSENAARVVESLRAHETCQIVISGIVDPEHGVAHIGSGDSASVAALTHVRLRCSWEELRRRYLGRGSPADTLDRLRDVARQYDLTPADSIDTTARSLDEVAEELVARHCTIRPTERPPLPPPTRAARLPTTVLYGPTAVGTSTVGWELVRRRWTEGRATAYIDVEQLGFQGPTYDRSVHAAVYSALTHGYASAGADELIVVTHDPQLVLAAHDRNPPTCLLLDAEDDVLSARVALRSQENTGLLAGDELLGADSARQAQFAARARREAADFRRDRSHDDRIDTTNQSPTETVGQIETLLANR